MTKHEFKTEKRKKEEVGTEKFREANWRAMTSFNGRTDSQPTGDGTVVANHKKWRRISDWSVKRGAGKKEQPGAYPQWLRLQGREPIAAALCARARARRGSAREGRGLLVCRHIARGYVLIDGKLPLRAQDGACSLDRAAMQI